MPRLAEAAPPVTRIPWVAFVRVTRPWNLLMIVLTMWVIRLRVLPVGGLSDRLFLLEVLTMVFAAAGGNMINDYFDIREDLVNKPRRALVGRVLKRRVALAGHHALAALSIACAAVLAYWTRDWRMLAWPVALNVVLWGYSPWWKRRFLLGNLAIGLIVGQLPLWTALPSSQTSAPVIVGFAVLSFLFTVLREVTKDLQDRDGDAAAGYDTLAVRWGASRTALLLKISHIAGMVILCGTAAWLRATAGIGWPNALYLLPFTMATWMLFDKNLRAVSAYQKLTLGGGVAVLIWF